MGQVASQACKRCNDCLSFLPVFKKKNHLQYLELVDIQPPKYENKEITEDKKSEVSSTDEHNSEYVEFLEIYQKPLDADCDKMYDKDGFLIYGQDLEEGFLLKVQWESQFEAQNILDYFRIAEERKIWDKNIESIEEMPGESDDEFKTYTKFKKVIAISQRESMIVSTVYERDDGVMVISRSCEHEKYPESEGITRMKIFLAGYYFKRLVNEKNKTKAFALTKASFGGSISQKFVKKATALALPKMYQAMEKGMIQYYKSHNQTISG